MVKCTICGSELIGNICRFDVPIEEAPWITDYNQMALNKIEHKEHQRMVANWNLHHKEQVSKKVIHWAEGILKD